MTRTRGLVFALVVGTFGVACSDSDDVAMLEDEVAYSSDALQIDGSLNGDADDSDDVASAAKSQTDLDTDTPDPFAESDLPSTEDEQSGVTTQSESMNLQDENIGTSTAALSRSGINGTKCQLSAYNCRLRDGGNRVQKDDSNPDILFSNVSWLVNGGELRDGNGDVIGVEPSGNRLKFNYGLTRTFNVGGAPMTHGYVLTSTARSGGWFPLAKVTAGKKLASKIGHVTAHSGGLAKGSCYQIRSTYDHELAAKKVTYRTLSASGEASEAAGDYLPKVRAGGRISVNLLFSLPGVGGAADDHFPAGTKFQRLYPTRFDGGKPSISIKLWTESDGKPQPWLLTEEVNGIKDPVQRKKKMDELHAKSKFTKRWSKDLTFVYGTITAKTGAVRVGWIALDALERSTGCAQ